MRGMVWCLGAMLVRPCGEAPPPRAPDGEPAAVPAPEGQAAAASLWTDDERSWGDLTGCFAEVGLLVDDLELVPVGVADEGGVVAR